jgi:hypothetical protein
VLEPDKVLVIHDFLSSEECADLIRRSKGFRYEQGTVADVVIEDVRNNDRVLVDDFSLASDLFRRAEPSLPSVVEGCRLVGFNERWRFYRYQPGQTFKPHRDGSYFRSKSLEESQITFMIYLNDGMTAARHGFLQTWNRHSDDVRTFLSGRRQAWHSSSYMPFGTKVLSCTAGRNMCCARM